MSDVEQSVVGALLAAGKTVATAESLTAGMVAAAIATVPGASGTLAGGVISYNNEVKTALLGVDDAVLRREGAVCATVAEQMAAGAAARLHTDYALSTTGVAGPEPHQGKAVGTVFIGVHTPQGTWAEEFSLSGNREQIRQATVAAALTMLARALKETAR